MLNNESKLTTLFISIITVCIIVIFIPVFVKDSSGYMNYIILLSLIPLAALGWFVYHRMSILKLLRRLKEQWGKEVIRKRDFKDISKLFKACKNDRSGRFYIDDQTWEDLNMDQIFAGIDRTLTTPGEHGLYNILRTPLFDMVSLKRRSDAINLLQEDSKIREALQLRLSALGRQKGSNTQSMIWGDIPAKSPLSPLYIFMSFAALASLASIAVIGLGAVVLTVLPVFGINFYINYKVKKKILAEISSMNYMASLIVSGQKIGKFKNPAINYYTETIGEASLACDRILKKIGKMASLQTGDIMGAVYEYINIFFLNDVRSFYAAVGEIKAHSEELKQIYLMIGEVDALLSTASYRAGLSVFVEPELFNEGAVINLKDARHPLLKDPVPNSITINKEGIIITGCNMSGKSTFLRTLGVNALFAQTIFTCPAAYYSGSYLRVITSISRGDNLVGGKSYYLAEAEALLRIIKASGDMIPCLCIIDEMFRGTNSIERINASAEILRYLVSHNCLVIIATHDFELTEMVEELYKCYYFSECINEEGISFDYTIKGGVSRMRNAVRLMDYLGYPKEIIDSINSRIADTDL